MQNYVKQLPHQYIPLKREEETFYSLNNLQYFPCSRFKDEGVEFYYKILIISINGFLNSSISIH